MIPEELEKMIVASLDAKEIPFAVALTCGATVLGSFDPIEDVALITKKYNIWLHVDVN
jgi:glutamate/tyrosine decarboxylase-like PLP-dependent enzyme